MNDALQRTLERTRQIRETQRAAARTVVANSPSSTLGVASTAIAGARVFDVVSGLEGEVIHVARENIVVHPPE